MFIKEKSLLTCAVLLLLTSAKLSTVLAPPVSAYTLPAPLSAEDRERLRKIGAENAAKYGNGPSEPAPAKKPVVAPKPTPSPTPIPKQPVVPKSSRTEFFILNVMFRSLFPALSTPQLLATNAIPTLLTQPLKNIKPTPTTQVKKTAIASPQPIYRYGKWHQPGTASYHFELGFSIWQDSKDWKAAKAEYAKALAIDPNYPPALSSYGMIVGAFEYKFPESEEKLKRAMELDPTWAYASFNLSSIYKQQGKEAEANQWRDYTLEHFKDSPDYEYFQSFYRNW